MARSTDPLFSASTYSRTNLADSRSMIQNWTTPIVSAERVKNRPRPVPALAIRVPVRMSGSLRMFRWATSPRASARAPRMAK